MFDGHGGFAAAEYLQQNLYKIYTRVLDQKSMRAELQMSGDDLPGGWAGGLLLRRLAGCCCGAWRGWRGLRAASLCAAHSRGLPLHAAGLACPITFTPVLTDAFRHADEDLLAWMHGACLRQPAVWVGQGWMAA